MKLIPENGYLPLRIQRCMRDLALELMVSTYLGEILISIIKILPTAKTNSLHFLKKNEGKYHLDLNYKKKYS